MKINLSDWCHIDNGILSFKSSKKFIFRIVVRDLAASSERVVFCAGRLPRKYFISSPKVMWAEFKRFDD